MHFQCFFFFFFLFLPKEKMCTYFVGLTMQVQKEKKKNLIKNIETVPVMMFILCGCARSTLEGAFL